MVAAITTGCLGFGRMGPKRELKFALEKYWRGDIDSEELLRVAANVEESAWSLQVDAGIDKIAVGDYCLYDNILQWADWLGIVPDRFSHMEQGLSRMFAMARGIDGAPALSMKKWLTSNYHYLVPEVEENLKRISPNFTSYFKDVNRAISKLGADKATPVVIGPVSLVRFCSFKTEENTDLQRSALLDMLLPVYKELLAKLSETGVTEIQIHEPVLAFEEPSLSPLFQHAYPSVLGSINNTSINMVSFFEDIGEQNYNWLTTLKNIKVLTLDFTRGNSLSLVKKYGVPDGMTLGVGIIDGRNVWKVDPSVVSSTLSELKKLKINSLRIQPSSSLQFVPWDLSCEERLQSHTTGPVLAFGKQKLTEVVAVANYARGKPCAVLDTAKTAWRKYKIDLSADQTISKEVASLTEADFTRSEVYSVRRKKQLPGLPPLPTTTIGSFPQTKEIRSLRNKLKKKLITKEEYTASIDQQISFMIGIQEALGLDIFVHGEPERTDMVEYFGQQMEGMLFSQNGWVQSFGSRCVRPPIFWNDISRPTAMTTREFKVAQNLTKKPVKGMLTGPVTILNWSFTRIDISRKEQAMQIGLALRKEIADLEEAGCMVIQVDEPALREAMPLRSSKKDEYLKWTVDSFRLATGGAKSETQIHTHMCYCEFADCMDAIDRMDADVMSIENARSDDATLRAFKGYDKGLGPGTYDIHSPVVPTKKFIEDKLKMFLQSVEVESLVVNPDCGLKTRTWPESIGAIQNMVAATETVRATLNVMQN